MMITLTTTVLIALAPLSPAVTAVEEDSPAWDCASMGNRVCGPANVQGRTAGCYDDAGRLVAAWPCFVVVNESGDADVFTPDER